MFFPSPTFWVMQTVLAGLGAGIGFIFFPLPTAALFLTPARQYTSLPHIALSPEGWAVVGFFLLAVVNMYLLAFYLKCHHIYKISVIGKLYIGSLALLICLIGKGSDLMFTLGVCDLALGLSTMVSLQLNPTYGDLKKMM